MASALFLGGFPLCIPHRIQFTVGSSDRCLWSMIAEPTTSASQTTVISSRQEQARYLGWDDSDYRSWKDKEAEILDDIQPIILLTKEILHSDRYADGERLNAEHAKTVVQRLLIYHPHASNKIGCGFDSIMVNRHPQFRHSRCLFVIRTDGAWIDFSYQKCLRAYIREKYPSHAERFIKEHFKRGSG